MVCWSDAVVWAVAGVIGWAGVRAARSQAVTKTIDNPIDNKTRVAWTSAPNVDGQRGLGHGDMRGQGEELVCR